LGNHIREVKQANKKEDPELEAYMTDMTDITAEPSVTPWRGKEKVKQIGPRPSTMELLSPVQLTTLNHFIEVGSFHARTHQGPGQLFHSIELEFTLPAAPTNILQHCKQLKALRIHINDAQTSRRGIKGHMGIGVHVGLDLSNLLGYNLQLNKLEIMIAENIEWWLSENEVEGDAAKLEADRISARMCPTYAQVLEAFKNEVIRVGEQVVAGRGEGQLAFHEDHLPAFDNLGHDKLRFLGGSRERSERPEMSEWKGTTLSWRFKYTKAKGSDKDGSMTAPPRSLIEDDGVSKEDRKRLFHAVDGLEYFEYN
jgi:hypothetical protein